MSIIRKIPNLVFKTVLVILGIIDAIGLGAGELLAKIKIAWISEKYDTLMALFPGVVEVAKQYIIVFILLTVVVFVLLFLKRERMAVLAHFSLDEINGKFDDTFQKKYTISEVRLEQSSAFVNGIPIDDRIFVDINRVVDKMKKKSKKQAIGYYGVAYIPIVFLVGVKFGNQLEVHMFHRKRNNSGVFTELIDEDANDIILIENEKGKTKNTKELVVAISTTTQISDDVIKKSFGDDKHLLVLSTNNQGYDILTQYKTIERLVAHAWKSIRRCEREYSIDVIHLVMATSVPVALYMGMSYSTQMDSKVIVYHYKSGNYPWGIEISGGHNSIVRISSEADSNVIVESES